MYSYLLTFVISLSISLSLTPLVRELAKKKGWVDRPDGKRKIHDIPIPRVGGIGIYSAILLSLIPVFFLYTEVGSYLRGNVRSILSVLLLAGLMMLVGLWDDLKNISPWKKIAAQALIGILCWLVGFRILEVWAIENVFLWKFLSLPVTVLWIIVITNAFNLIDGMDGLASGAALFSTLAILVVSIAGSQQLPTIILLALAGAVVGFLRYNFNPASIYLGDSGSMLLGFLLSLVSIIGSQKSTVAFAIAVPIVALGLPVLDTTLSIARRFVRGRPIFSADNGHIHHLLMHRGFTTRNAVIMLYGICGLFGLFSLCFINPSGKTNGVILAILGFCVLFGIQKLRYSELSVLKGHLSRGLQNQRKLLAAGVVVQHIIEGMQKSENLKDLVDSMGRGLEELCFSRFEIVIPNDETSGLIISGENWTVMPLALGGTVLRWTSPCRRCNRIQDINSVSGLSVAESAQRRETLSCEGCEGFKHPILQRNILANLKDTANSGLEYQIAVPLCGQNGADLGIVKFYHPTGEDYPVSAIAVLSQNIVREFEKSLQRILSGKKQFPEEVSGEWLGSAVPQSGSDKRTARSMKHS